MSDHQGAVTQGVDDPGDPPGKFPDQSYGLRFENARFISASCDLHAVLDVLIRLVAVQGVEVITDADPLPELPEPLVGQDLVQLGLAHQDDLQELAFRGLQVRQQPNLLEELGRERLGLVDDEHDALLAGVALEQEFVQQRQQIALRRQALRLQAQVVADVFQEVRGGELGVEQVRRARVAVEPGEHHLDERGLARAGLARDDRESLRLAEGVGQVGVGRTMLLAQVEEPQVGAELKRVFGKTVKFLVHDKPQR